MSEDTNKLDQWDSGELGQSMDHAVPAPEGSLAAIDASTGMQLISIRLQRTLIADLKAIAEHHGISYQPMIRDLLNRFAEHEIKALLHARLEQLEKQEAPADEQGPVADFLRKRA
jgi:predicted DNA binding CopG/RHH family protein